MASLPWAGIYKVLIIFYKIMCLHHLRMVLIEVDPMRT